MLSRPVSGTAALFLQEFIDIVGGRLYWYDPEADVPFRTAVERVFGPLGLPYYDIAGADYLLSFGAPFLDHWLSPVSHGVAFGRMRQARATVRGRFVHVEPRFSLTAASADRWIPVRPGTEGLLALAVGHAILAEAPDRPGAARRKQYQRLFGPVSLPTIARQTDVEEPVILQLARELAAARHPLILGGGSVSGHTNSTPSLMAINGLNGLLGNIDQPGGVSFFERPSPPSGSPAPRWLTEGAVEGIEREFQSGKASVLLLNDCNPVFGMPPAVPVARLFSRASFVASFSQFLDESSSRADLICATHHWLEAWGDGVPDIGLPVGTMSLQQPAVRPLYDTRQTGDLLLDIARSLKPGRVPWKSVPDLLHSRWREATDAAEPASPDTWTRHLQQGGVWSRPARSLPVGDAALEAAPDPPAFMGDERQFPFVLYPYPSMTVGYGGAHLPWLQELPDTLTTGMWGSWVEINPATAARLGIQQGDIVRLESLAGSVEAPVLFYPGLRPELLAMPIGQGHDVGTRYERGRGVNPLQLLAPAFDPDSGAFAIGATRVRLERTGRKGRVVLLQQPAVSAADLIQIDSKPG
jgi:anaerobic selenocysteine-containing dehydrogenase